MKRNNIIVYLFIILVVSVVLLLQYIYMSNTNILTSFPSISPISLLDPYNMSAVEGMFNQSRGNMDYLLTHELADPARAYNLPEAYSGKIYTMKSTTIDNTTGANIVNQIDTAGNFNSYTQVNRPYPNPLGSRNKKYTPNPVTTNPATTKPVNTSSP